MSELHDRVERGLAIAATADQIEMISAGLWSVRSQSGDGVYLVSQANGSWKCICPDFTKNLDECKHVIAVRLFTRGITPSEARQAKVRRPRPTFRQRWPEYRPAQRAELSAFDDALSALVENLQDPAPAGKTGRPRLPFKDLVYCAIQRVYQGLPLGLAHGLNDRLQQEGRTSISPSRNMTSVLLNRPNVAPMLHMLVAATAKPLVEIERAFSVDSTGFCTTLRGDYCLEKYGGRGHALWQKAHIIVGVSSHIVAGVVITGPHGADVTQFPELIRKAVDAGFKLEEVSADRAYLSAPNCQVVEDAGGRPFILFKESNHGRRSHRNWPGPASKHMWYSFKNHKVEFMEHYFNRENVESVISAIKRKLGEKLRSRGQTAQVNELLCKIIAYNITVLIHESFENGISHPAPTILREENSTGVGRQLAKSPDTYGGMTDVEKHPDWSNN